MEYLPDKYLIEKIESSKKKLIDSLYSEYTSIQLGNLSKIAERIELNIIAYLNIIIFENSKILFKMNPSKDGLHLLSNKGAIYQILSASNIKQHNQLIIRFNNIREYEYQDKEFIVCIESFGKCSEVIVTYPQSIGKGFKIPLIQYWVKQIIEVAYFWFFDTVGTLVNKDLSKLSIRLYDYIVKYIESEEIRKNLWFSAMTDGYGFRLINDELAKQSFNIFKRNLNDSLSYSANRYVSELLSTYLPENIMLMKKAIEKGKCIDVDLKDAVYKEDRAIYALTMSTLYGCDSFTVYPIYKGDKFSVGSVFDTKNKEFIQPFLDVHRENIMKICVEHSGNIKKIFRIITKEKLISFWDALELKPNFGGIGINLKKLFNKDSKTNK